MRNSLFLALASLTTQAAAAPASAADVGDAAIGSKLFLQCRACHTVTPGEPNGVGPNLNGVVGAKAGGRPGYVYSTAMQKSGLVWDTATLDAFLKRPTSVVPGTKMTFAGVAAPKARLDLIAYLATLKAGRK
jgi:cytochrome c